MALVETFDAQIVKKDFDESVEAGQFIITATDNDSFEQVYFYAAHEQELTDPWEDDGVLTFDVPFPRAGTFLIQVSRLNTAGETLISKDGTLAEVSVLVTVNEPEVKKIAIPVGLARTPA